VGAPVSFQFEESDIQSVQEAVRKQADGLIADGGTAIYSALTAAELVAKEEIQRDPGRLVSIVLLTDGLNNEGVTFDQFKDSHRSGTAARIFPILFGEGNVAEMQALAQLAGGRVFDGRKSRLALVFKEIRGYQ
jgi:Ca-activated chloride channel family protein